MNLDWAKAISFEPHSRWMPLDKATEFARTLKLKTAKQWKMFCQSGNCPSNIPRNPNMVYAGSGWVGWWNFLGTGFIPWQIRKYVPFKDALEFARSSGIKTRHEWGEKARHGLIPANLPINPDEKYAGKGWKSWGHFLGTKSIISFWSFDKARSWARKQCFASSKKWHQSNRIPRHIPSGPQKFYRNDGWAGWGDFLGNGFIAYSLRKYVTYKAAKAYAHRLHLKNQVEWKRHTKSEGFPKDIPRSPWSYYSKSGNWKGWGDFLGTNNIASTHRQFRSFEDARKYAISLNLNSEHYWRQHCRLGKLPKDIPTHPNRKYKDFGWAGWTNFLGTDTRITSPMRCRKPANFQEARLYARSLGLKCGREWRELGRAGKLPTNMPTMPSQSYAGKGWMGWGDFLGTGNRGNSTRTYVSFSKALAYARSLHLKKASDWYGLSRNKELQVGMPGCPDKVYKNKWKGWGHFLGTNFISRCLREYRPYEAAREYAKSLNLRVMTDWIGLYRAGKLPRDLPCDAAWVYKDEGWTTWSDFLGSFFKTYNDARESVRALQLKSQADWLRVCKTGGRPKGVPANPHVFYRKSGTWVSWEDWLGTFLCKGEAA